MANKEEVKSSTRLRDTHLRLNPFLNDMGARYVVYCHSACHPGFLRVPDLKTRPHCCPESCRSYIRIPLENNHIFDIPRIVQSIEEEKDKILLGKVGPTLKFTLQRNDRGNINPLGILDRGQFVYITYHGKENLVDQIERDHLSFYFNDKSFKPRYC